jgi:hypothetical protein
LGLWLTEPPTFSGILGRVYVDARSANLRFYPFVFEQAPDANPVFVVRCEQPAFSAEDIATILENECDVEVRAHEIQLYSYFLGEDRTLRATAVSTSWQPYDLDDYRDHIARLTDLERRTDESYRRVETRNRNALAQIDELCRRAELKADAPGASRQAQDATLKALAWVRRKLLDD